MVKQQFANLAIDLWVHRAKNAREKLGFAEPCLCLFHDSIQTGSPILDALHELQRESPPARRMLSFAPCPRKGALTSLRLIAVPLREDLQVMNIRHDGEVATIEMTDRGLTVLIDACITWLAGGEDFRVSADHARLRPKELGKLDCE